MTTELKAGAVQAAPVYMDTEATVEKTIRLIEEAAASGIELLVFPEAWLPGYPFWAWLDAPAWGMQFVKRYHGASVVRNGPEIARIADAARAANMVIGLGTSERDHGTLYLGQTVIESDGTILKHRRKLKPTHVERSVFGEGDGSDIEVMESSLGRLGGLCCWEHLQPLVKAAMYSQHEQVHMAAWPSFSVYRDRAYALGAEVNAAASQIYAVEGGCFVVAATAVVDQATQDLLCDTDVKRNLLPLGGGKSMIYGPDGRPLAEFLPPEDEGIVSATIVIEEIALAKAAADPAGHYGRGDVLRLLFDPSSRQVMERMPTAFADVRAMSPPSGPETSTPEPEDIDRAKR